MKSIHNKKHGRTSQPKIITGRLHIEGRELRVIFQRHPKAKRYIVRVHSPFTLKVTLPRYGNIYSAKQFLKNTRPWIIQQLDKIGPVTDLKIGESIPLNGSFYEIQWDLSKPGFIRVGRLSFPWSPENGSLREFLRNILYEFAQQYLPNQVGHYAEKIGLYPSQIKIRDQRSRWGSCSTNGTVSLNWRLVLMPPFVRDYIIIHELTHLKIKGHGNKFWACVKNFLPTWKKAEKWLQEHGMRLMMIFPSEK